VVKPVISKKQKKNPKFNMSLLITFLQRRFCIQNRSNEVKKPMTKNLSISIAAAFALCLLLGIGQVFAQATVTGGINGKVSDPQSAIVPNATVKNNEHRHERRGYGNVQ
jgi:hypothetical protein